MRLSRQTVLLVATAFLVAAAGCGGGGGGGAAATGSSSALTVAEKVSVVDAQPGTGSPAPIRNLKTGWAAVRAAMFNDNAEYNTDRTNVYVQERSIQAFNTANNILCMVAQTKYDAFLNLGEYTAQVDKNLCEASSGGGNGNQSSGSNAPLYAKWTVNVTRASDSAPQYVTAWIHEPPDGDMPSMQIRAKMTITEGVSGTNPYGIFRIDFVGHPETAGTPDTGTTLFKGFLLTERDTSGKILLKYSESGSSPGGDYVQQATLDRASDGSTGGGTIQQDFGPGGASTFDLAYNATEFLRSGTGDICLDRTAFDESVWRYGLYESDNGARVNRNSGFSVKVTQGGQDYFGWVGYYGTWFPNEVSLANGDTVYKQTNGPGSGTSDPYQVFIGGGKLFKHTRKALTLGDIRNVALQYQNFDGGGPGTPYRIVWDNGAFNKVAVADANWNWSSTAGTLAFDNLSWPNVSFWSDALSGEVQLNPGAGECTQDGGTFRWSCAFTNATQVIVYERALVYPGDNVPASLACFDQCPDAAAIDTSNPQHPFSGMIGAAPATAVADNAYVYDVVSDASNYVLKEGALDVVRTAQGAAGTPYQYGVQTGPLFEVTAPNLALLACDWDNTGNTTCPWQARSRVAQYYTWETGPNNWNRLTALKSGSTFLKFDPPLQVEYVHSWAGGSTSKLFLEYAGFGNLQGIPGTCVDIDTGALSACGPTTRWVPEFNIPTGTVVASGGTDYYVKQLDKEQRMRANPAGCATLTTQTYSLLPIASWTDPAIGNEPMVTDPPKVIGGIVQ